MITQNLVDLIHSGQAQYRTWIIGVSGSSRIPVPKNNYIVITDFHYHHFQDRNPLSVPADRIAEMFRNSVHGLSFRSFGSEFTYMIRSGFLRQPDGGVNNEYLPDSEAKYDTYQVHKTDCHVDIWRMTDPAIWTLNGGKLDNATSEQAGPLGYGTVNNTPNQNVQRSVLLGGAGQQFVPYGENQGLVLGSDWREQFKNDIDNLSALYPPAIADLDANNTYPIINVGYVLVNVPFGKNTR